MAVTFTTTANGYWNSGSTWVGGAGNNAGTGKKGGSGIVIIRYSIS